MNCKKFKKVYWCEVVQHTILESYCRHCVLNDLEENDWDFGDNCLQGNFFNSCKLISENCHKDIKWAWK